MSETTSSTPTDSAKKPRLLEGKNCLITGGSRNLGRFLCLEFAKAGANIAFTFHQRDQEAQQTIELLKAEGCEPLVFQGSVSDAKHVNETIKALVEAWGQIDILVNNAGLTQILPIGLLEEKDWDKVMATNVKGPYLFSRAVLRPMIRARRGHILNISSFAADRIVGAPVHYAASKAALRAFSDALAKEVGRYNIQVNALSPGMLDVGMSQRLPRHYVEDYTRQAALGELVSSQKVAKLAVWLVSDQNTFMTGSKIVVDGGL